MIVDLEIEAASVSGPDRVAWIAVERGDFLRATPIEVHEVDLGCLKAGFRGGIAGVGDALPVRRDGRRGPYSALPGKSARRAARYIDDVEVGVSIVHVRGRVVHAFDHDRSAVGCPGPADRTIQNVEPCAYAPIA